jgi:hypothetical protein
MMLNLTVGDQVIDTVPSGGWFELPDGTKASPAQEGWTDGTYSLVAVPPPAPPTPEEELAAERANMRLSFAQLIIGLVAEAWISEADGEGWLQGILPSTVISTLNLLPEEQRFAAKVKAARPSYIDRMDPLVEMMALAQGHAAPEVDTFFRTYAAV